jgi:uncharacterized protein YwqG
MDKADIADIQEALKQAGLARVLKDIAAISQPAIRLYPHVLDEASIAVGTSKFGGAPDLPPDIAWPTWHGLPQSFIAQIRLDDACDYDVAHLLPRNGMLWFFYDAKQETYGDDPADHGGWSVFFRGGHPASLRRASIPTALPKNSLFAACAATFAVEWTLTQMPQLEIAQFDWSDEEQHRYEQVLAAVPDAADRALSRHHLLGFPDTIQDDMREQCQLISNGVTADDDPRAQTLARGAQDWQLLLQIDTDEHIGMRWASSGMLYYWLKQADLKDRRFEQSWLVLQSE